jgi:hypothetical protein
LSSVAVASLPSPGWELSEVDCDWRQLRCQIHTLLIRGTRITSACAPELRIGLEVLQNCPYLSELEYHYSHKLRGRLIRTIDHPENRKSVNEMAMLLSRHPPLLKIVGWCGGSPLHVCSRLGNWQQIDWILRSLDDPTFRRRGRLDPLGLVQQANLDGYTPILLAEMFGHEDIAHHLKSWIEKYFAEPHG